MVKNKCVIDIAKCTLTLNNQTIAYELESQLPSLFRITICQKVTIPPRSEMMVKANINEGATGKANLVIDSIAECKNLLTPEQTGTLRDLLHKNQKAFSMSKYDIGLTDIVQHKINTNGAPPVKQAPRRLPIAQRNEFEVEIHKMLDNDIIRPSQSPYSSPLVIVRKADLSIRVCCDFRRVNLDSVKDSYPLPRIDDSLDALRGNAWFSTLDLVSGYYQVAMDPQDAPKTAFVTSQGLFHIKYRAGLKHGNADGLSRRPCSMSCTHCEKQENQKQAEEKSNSPEIRAMSANNQDQVVKPYCYQLGSRKNKK
ncbi:unnamed protein product [Mytilus coruscus]|uniref:Reverse transcriptase domain-containing protein n=1 Tax=Mytilus coruscus TaxID=42192 RepID=A0A6J8DR42_MYTCO|nr:unnamed protein product [Mytilus coruscus]